MKLHLCNECGNTFSNAPNLHRHRTKGYCKGEMRKIDNNRKYTSFDDLCDQVNKLTSMLNIILDKETRHGSVSINTTGNHNNTNVTQTTNNTTLQINPYGMEKTDYLTDLFVAQCVRNLGKGIVDLAKAKHFSLNHPENHNIKPRKDSKKLVRIYDGDIWVDKIREEILGDLYKSNTEFLDTYFCDNEDMFKDGPGYKAIDAFFEKARNAHPDVKNPTFTNLSLMIDNESARLKKHSNSH